MSDQATHLRSLLERKQTASSDEGGVVGTLPPPTPQHATVPPSAPIGVVSYGPICSRPAVKRHVPGPRPARLTVAPPRPLRLARTIGICSGKGGVGKSSLAVNLAVAMSQPREVGGLGLKVCLLDADLGMANADVLCNLKPRLTLEHVVSGRCQLKDVLMLAPGGFRLIPGASGVARMADLSPTSRQVILQQLTALEQVADVILIDCGAGISSNVAAFAAAAAQSVIATTPEPTAMTDGYAMVKTILTRSREAIYAGKWAADGSTQSVLSEGLPDIHVVVNMTAAPEEGAAVFARMNRVSTAFLQHPLKFAGAIPYDPAVIAAVRQRMPFALYDAESPASRVVRRLAWRLAGREPSAEIVDNSFMGTARPAGFFARLAVWLGVAEFVD